MHTADAAFRHSFGHGPDGVWMAPGRVNLIGEHTDYNDGFVLPMALPQGVTVAAAQREDGVLRFVSRQSDHHVETHLDRLEPHAMSGWAAHPAGVLWALRERGHRIGGFDVLVDGTVPEGAGLSSSAALACATGLAVTDLAGIALNRSTIARVAQEAENGFVGMPCGILDQSASMLSSARNALFLDTRSLEHELVPFDPAEHGLTLLVINTNAPHRLVDGEYATRRRTCEKAAARIGLSALRDIDPARLDTTLSTLTDATERRRVRHVVTENQRVLDVVRLLRAGRTADVGPALTASHSSLRDDYEVTVAELDVAVDAAVSAGALGARMTGGGFGGCVIALVSVEGVDTCTAAVHDAFAEHGFTEPTVFPAAACEGAHRLDATVTNQEPVASSS